MFLRKNHQQKRHFSRTTDLNYFVTCPVVVKHINKATEQFKRFIEERRDCSSERPIKKAAEFFIDAINDCRSDTDKAYCCRKYATTIIRDNVLSVQLRYTLASEHLDKSISLYEKYLKNPCDNREIIILELQQAYILLGNVALKLKQGDMLRRVLENLPGLLEELRNRNYEAIVPVYAYHLNLSEENIDEAKKCIRTALEMSADPTDYRHLAKVNLLTILRDSGQTPDPVQFSDDVLDNLWKSFDAHKEAKAHKALLDDFRIILYAKIAQRLHNMPDNRPHETVFDYMKRQVYRVYFPSSLKTAGIIQIVRQYIEEIRDTGKMTLAYQLFKTPAPGVEISPEQFNNLFPDMVPATKPDAIIAPKPVRPGPPGFFNDADVMELQTEYQSRAASSTSPDARIS